MDTISPLKNPWEVLANPTYLPSVPSGNNWTPFRDLESKEILFTGLPSSLDTLAYAPLPSDPVLSKNMLSFTA